MRAVFDMTAEAHFKFKIVVQDMHYEALSDYRVLCSGKRMAIFPKCTDSIRNNPVKTLNFRIAFFKPDFEFRGIINATRNNGPLQRFEQG